MLLAAVKGHLELVKWLLANGMSLNERCNKGNTGDCAGWW